MSSRWVSAGLLAGLLTAAAPLTAAPRWTALGPFGGPVDFLTADPTAPRTLYAGAIHQGIFKSTDGGASWSRIHAASPRSSVAVDPTRPGTLYVTADFDRILKSTDGGATWTERSLAGPAFLGAIAVDPVRPNRVYLAADGVWRSIDSGVTWRKTGISGRIHALVAPPRPAGTVFAATDRGVFKSENAGLTWKSASVGMPASEVRALAPAPSNPRVLWAVSFAGIFRSTNGGAFWRRTAGLPVGTYEISLAVSTTAPWAAWVGTYEDGLYRTADAGAHWTLVGPRPDARVPALAAAGPTLFAGVDPQGTDAGGILASADGGVSWQPRNRGFTNFPVFDLALDPRDPRDLWSAAGEGGLFHSPEGGQDWQPIPRPQTPSSRPGLTRVALSADGAALYALDHEELWTSGDDGASWRRLLGGGPAPPLSVSFFLPHPLQATDLYAGNFRELYASHDSGATWSSVWPGFPCAFTTLAAGPSAPSILYAAGTVNSDFTIPCRNTKAVVYRSVDGGASWTANDGGLPGTRAIASLAVDPADPQTLYAAAHTWVGTGAGLWKSTNGGASWARISPESDRVSVYSVAISPADGAVWMSTQTEVFVSRDGGATWKSAGAPPINSIGRLVPDPDDPGRLYAAGGGVWRLEDEP